MEAYYQEYLQRFRTFPDCETLEKYITIYERRAKEFEKMASERYWPSDPSFNACMLRAAQTVLIEKTLLALTGEEE